MVHHTSGMRRCNGSYTRPFAVKLDQADALDATGKGEAGLGRGDAIGHDGAGVETRAAVPIDGHAGHCNAESGLERGTARDVVTGRASGQSAAEDDVFHLRRVDARTLDHLPQHVRGHGNVMSLVERAAAALAIPVRQYPTIATSFMR